jgi:3-methyladenine DNA glycosylase/8-oxoguanine DNA glycosylase
LTLRLAVQPRGPYSLALTARLAGDATRRLRDGVLTAAVGGELARAWQRPDGAVVLEGGEAACARLRWLLALDDDHSELVRRFRDDTLLREPLRQLRGLRQIRVDSVAHALLRALCGQLIESSRARALERVLVRRLTPAVGDGLHRAPSCADLVGASPAQLRAVGLHARRGAALVRICSALELERLHALPTQAAAARLERERGLGPWSVGVVCLEGLGRSERGLVADLGLIKLVSALRGRRAEGWETEELLAPYGEWAGLASVYLLAGFGRGLVPLPDGSRASRRAARLAPAA